MPTFTFQDIFKSSFLERLDAVSLPDAAIALALAFLVLGVWRGEATVVWRKAAQICLECIGLA